MPSPLPPFPCSLEGATSRSSFSSAGAQGGGFCGTRTNQSPYDLRGFDGICLRVKAQGQRFKLNLKTVRGGRKACGGI